jgi:hypothetical protein
MAIPKHKTKTDNTAYSSSSLTYKLGIKEGFIIKLINPPSDYFKLLFDLPGNITINEDDTTKKNFIHYFAKEAATLPEIIQQIRNEIVQNGMIWVSWPKKSSNVKTDLTEDFIRDTALQNGLVDIKVCSIDEIWSALKLVIRLKDRKK